MSARATLVELPNGTRIEVATLDDGSSRLTITQAYPRCTYVCEDLPAHAAAELAEQLMGEPAGRELVPRG
jgi:hypothetical protein